MPCVDLIPIPALFESIPRLFVGAATYNAALWMSQCPWFDVGRVLLWLNGGHSA